jgi:protein subunit release factor A
MLERLRHVVDEYETIEQQLADPEVLADSDELRRLSKRYNELGPVVDAYRRREARRADADAAREMLSGASGAEREMLVAEIDGATAEAAAIEDELRELMLPADPHDGKNVIMEIRGAEGGEEANLFARDLYEMYLAYAASQRWKVETLSSSPSDMGGLNEVTFEVRVTHRPTGVVVSMQDERSQLQNKARAMLVLRARLFELAERERSAELSAERRSQVGGGGRSEKVRTYNFKENRVTDHRIGFTVYRLSAILGGDLQVVIDALQADERARLLAEGE